MLHRKICVGNVFTYQIPIVGTRHISDDTIIFDDRFFPRHHGVWRIQSQACKSAFRNTLSQVNQCVPTHKVPLLKFDSPTRSCFPGIVICMKIRAPHTIALFHPKEVERPTTQREHAPASSRVPEQIPHHLSILCWCIEFPTKFTNV